MKAIKTIIGVIPARWGSTRFPGKILHPLCGKPLIQWVYERARQARNLAELLVATDDDRIRAAAVRFGARVVMTDGSHPSGTDRIAEAIRGIPAEVVVNIQGDEPLIDPMLIERLGATLAAETADWEMATAACPIRDAEEALNPAVVKVVRDRSGRALYFSRALVPHPRDLGVEAAVARGLFWRHIGIYAYRRDFLDKLVATPPCALEQVEKLEQLRALDLGARIKVLEAAAMGIGVDTPADVPRAEEALRRIMGQGK